MASKAVYTYCLHSEHKNRTDAKEEEEVIIVPVKKTKPELFS